MFKNSEKGRFLATYRVTDDGGCDSGSRWLVVACGAFPLLLLDAVHSLSPSPLLPKCPPPFFSLFLFFFLFGFFLGFPFSFLFFLSFLFLSVAFLVKSSKTWSLADCPSH